MDWLFKITQIRHISKSKIILVDVPTSAIGPYNYDWYSHFGAVIFSDPTPQYKFTNPHKIWHVILCGEFIRNSLGRYCTLSKFIKRIVDDEQVTIL
jgi:hypothetical protein